MVLLSVIIPVYNAGNFLSDCFNSLLKQSIKSRKIEIIIINDGSLDNSEQIIEQFRVDLSKDYLVKIYSQNNQGIAKTRNKGLDLASGEYIAFLDSDDMLSTEYFEKILNIIEKNNSIDLIEINAYKFQNINDKKLFQCHFHGSGEILLTNNAKKSSLEALKWFAWSKIIKKAYYIDNYFPEVKSYEDQLLFPLIFIKCKKIWAIQEPLYYYRQNQSSLTHNIKLSHLEDFYGVFKQQLSDSDASNELLILNSFYNLFVYRYLLFEFYPPHQAYASFKEAKRCFFRYIKKNKMLFLIKKYKIRKKVILLFFFPYISVIYKYLFFILKNLTR